MIAIAGFRRARGTAGRLFVALLLIVDFAASVRSDLYFAILQSFRTEGIEMPFQQQ